MPPTRAAARNTASGFVRANPLFGLLLIGEVEPGVIGREDVAALAREPAGDGRAGQDNRICQKH